jgi:UDPglucose--hexose-1-phosphate uridylyltransferase
MNLEAKATDGSHRRRNALNGDWVTVSPQRAARPWQGEAHPDVTSDASAYDPNCYLCPGNVRVNGDVNPAYAAPWAFDNDFPAMSVSESGGLTEAELSSLGAADLFVSESASGRCRVLCYSPDHHKTLSVMTADELHAVIALWCKEVRALRQTHHWVQVFENRGEMMGCSNPHPHGQIWAVDYLPGEARKEDVQQALWREKHQSVLLQDYLTAEEAQGERVVLSNADWLVLVPYWAVWPFETLLLPRRHIAHLDDLDAAECLALAGILQGLLGAYDRLFDTPCPYTMGWHGAPCPTASPHWQLHAHFYPPLLRSASVRKHMVGYEMLSEQQRDVTPEAAAERLRQALALCEAEQRS